MQEDENVAINVPWFNNGGFMSSFPKANHSDSIFTSILRGFKTENKTTERIIIDNTLVLNDLDGLVTRRHQLFLTKMTVI